MNLEKMRAQLLNGRARQAMAQHLRRSLIAYGPPGTGKTTLMESLAVTSRTDLVTITPGDFLISGAESLERQAGAVMRALRMLTSRLILFDEFDTVLREREQSNSPISTIDFLTGSMLPKLADLGLSARRNRLAYVLATNYVDVLDAAAIRTGRFDHKRSVYYPDAPSRACRLVSELTRLLGVLDEAGIPRASYCHDGMGARLAEVVIQSAQITIANLCREGWFTAPKSIETNSKGDSISEESKAAMSPVWTYVLLGEGAGLDWPVPGAPDRTGQTSNTARRPVKNPHLAIERAALAAIVGHWDRVLHTTVRDGSRMSWNDLIALLSSRSVALRRVIIERNRRMARVRQERLTPNDSTGSVDIDPE